MIDRLCGTVFVRHRDLLSQALDHAVLLEFDTKDYGTFEECIDRSLGLFMLLFGGHHTSGYFDLSTHF